MISCDELLKHSLNDKIDRKSIWKIMPNIRNFHFKNYHLSCSGNTSKESWCWVHYEDHIGKFFYFVSYEADFNWSEKEKSSFYFFDALGFLVKSEKEWIFNPFFNMRPFYDSI